MPEKTPQLDPKPGRPAYGNSTFEVNSIADFVSLFGHIRQPRFYARGEPREYERPWVPTIWRDDHQYTDDTPIADADGNFTKGELEALKQCQADLRAGKFDDRYFREFSDDIEAPIDVASPDLLRWVALAQHYSNQNQRYPTRLLDVTTDALAALYFAVSDCPDQDGLVAWTKIDNGCNDLSALPATRTSGVFLDVLGITASDGGTDYLPDQETLNFIRPPQPNLRTEAQRGAFIWACGNQQSYFRNAVFARIPAESKAGLKRHLEGLNYSRSQLFPV